MSHLANIIKQIPVNQVVNFQMQSQYNKIPVFRLTHIENIPHILKYGITHRKSINKNPNYKRIGLKSLIDKRETLNIKVQTENQDKKVLLSNYIPFYFGNKSPMLYMIQNGYHVEKIEPEKVVYCVCRLNSFIDNDFNFYFTDGHPVTPFSKIYNNTRVNEIKELLDFEAINADYWANTFDDNDIKRRKEAELLVKGDIPFSLISGFVVYNENAKVKLIEYGLYSGKVIAKMDYYF